MIKKLRFKFIRIAMISVAIVLAVIIGIINIVNYNTVMADADRTLELIAGNNGSFPATEPADDKEAPPDDKDGSHGEHDGKKDKDDDRGPGKGRQDFSPEAPFETRYFSVHISEDGTVSSVDTKNIAAVDSEQAEEYAVSVYSSGEKRGTVDTYRFLRSGSGDGTVIVFTDITQKMNSFTSFLFASILIASAGLGAVFFLIWMFSGRIIRPIAESYEKQKQFITDAGHDIKTPITIINADAEVLEMEKGKSEWLDDIRLQTDRLAELTRDLIFLSRMEEDDPGIQKIEFPFSEVAQEAAQSFQSMARTQGKDFSLDIEPMLTVVGDEKSVRQLVTILTDNAVKYSPEGGDIRITAARKGRKVLLKVYNTTADAVSREDIKHMFDRFYRSDKSRNSEKGGYGIGLSIAKAVAEAHGGEIAAQPAGEKALEITVTLPAVNTDTKEK